jgi:hypothetical protein
MKKHFLGMALALAALVNVGTAGRLYSARIEDGAIVAPKPSIKKVVAAKPKLRDLVGDPLPVAPRFVNLSLTPKEYGLRYGTGASRKHKSNRNRYSAASSIRKRFNA